MKQIVHRRFDDGHGIALQHNDRPDGSREAVVLSMVVCDNADCPCRDVSVGTERVEYSSGRCTVRSVLAGTLNLDSGAFTLSPDADLEARDPELITITRDWLEAGGAELVRDRCKRIKGQASPDEWRQVDWSRIDREYVVPFMEVFPSRWDLAVFVDDQRYWAMDSWCLNRDCPCSEVVLELLADAGQPLGALRADARRFTIIDIETGDRSLVTRLAQALLADSEVRAELRLRRKLMRDVAHELPRFLAPAPPITARKPGRNEPCPCNSGRKYKHCCGRG